MIVRPNKHFDSTCTFASLLLKGVQHTLYAECTYECMYNELYSLSVSAADSMLDDRAVRANEKSSKLEQALWPPSGIARGHELPWLVAAS